MYANLLDNLKREGIAPETAAAAIGISEQAFTEKAESGHFSIDEAFTIKRSLLPAANIEKLFERTDKE